jgi:cytochrome c553
MRIVWIAAALFASSHGLMARQQATATTVFTAEQASAGRSAYAASCASCHMPDLSGSNDVPPLAGQVFMSTWRTRSTKDLLDYMSASMPPGLSSLSTETYASIAAFILESNGASAGAQPLSATTDVAIASLIAARGASRHGDILDGDRANPTRVRVAARPARARRGSAATKNRPCSRGEIRFTHETPRFGARWNRACLAA